MRLQTVYLFNKDLPEDKRINDPRALMPFPWEEPLPEEEVHVPTPDEWEALDRKYVKDKK